MKRILIIGSESYVGTSFEKWMAKSEYRANYQVETLSVRGREWKNFDFSPYAALFHVAGIAHVDVSKVSAEGKQLYYEVNRDLTIAVADEYKKKRGEMQSQFIYMSSLIIYGEEANINKKRVITKDTKPKPSNFYGDSKLQAEIGLKLIESENFKVAIIRSPMIYGSGSRGNFPLLVKLAKKLPFFPDIKNERSMLFVDNLAEFVRQLIDSGNGGVFFPQNSEYVSTSQMVREIAKVHGRKIYLFSWLNWLVRCLGYAPGFVGKMTNKAFGNLVCAKELSSDFTPPPVNFIQSIEETEL